MLVLDYGIECDLLEEGNVKIVDGEIEITSETFLRRGKSNHRLRGYWMDNIGN